MRRMPLLVVVAVMALVFVAALAAAAGLGTGSTNATSLAPVAASALAQSAQMVPGQGTTPGIVVTGEGTISVKPDVARVTLGVQVSNQSASAAQQDAAAKMDAVIAQLKQQGIAEKDIQTVRFDLSPEYDNSNRNPVVKGYRVTNLVLITERDISKLGGLLDTVVSSGATQIQGISFGVSDPTAATTQGREEAMKNARAKADQLAKLGGVTLGQPLSIEEVSSPSPAPMDVAVGAAKAAPSTPISPGTQQLTTVIRVTYAIK